MDFSKNIFRYKKAIGPVIAVALLLIVSTVSVISFQSWFNTYQTNINTDVEEKSSVNSMNTRIDTVIGNDLYFLNGFNKNLSIKNIKIGSKSCNISIELEPGMKNISFGNCTQGITETAHDIVIITDKGIFVKNVILKNLPIFNSYLSLTETNQTHFLAGILSNTLISGSGSTASIELNTTSGGDFNNMLASMGVLQRILVQIVIV